MRGKLLSSHVLPISAHALYGRAETPPSLVNYADDAMLVLRDGNGCIVPVSRSQAGGYKMASVPLLLQPSRELAIGLFNLDLTGNGGDFQAFTAVMTRR